MRKLFITLIVLGMISFSGCNALKQMIQLAEDQSITVDPNPLEVHADEVNFDMSVQLPVEMLKEGKVYTVNTFYQYGNDQVDAGSIEFRAEEFPNQSSQQPQKSESFSFPYEDGMDENGNLVVEGVASDPESGESMSTDPDSVARGIIRTSQLAQGGSGSYYVAYADHGYDTGEELIPVRINFFFQQNRDYLRNSEKQSDRGEKFRGFIADKNPTRTVTITGHHSPEGPEAWNTELSGNRAETIEEYYREQMENYDYQDAADEVDFVLKELTLDWGPFKDSLSDYDGISYSEKQEWLDIINGTGSFTEKEEELQELDTYNQVFEELYPRLRFSHTEILTPKDKKSDAEISVLAQRVVQGSVPEDTLSDAELMYAGTLTPDLDEKEDIYEEAVDRTGSWQAHNNLGAVYLQQAIETNSSSQRSSLMNQAADELETAASRQNNGATHNNLAVIALMQGNVSKASTEADNAESMMSSVSSQGFNGLKGLIEIQLAEYANAVTSLSNAEENADNLFNLGLAQVLNNEYENAITSFEEALSMESGYALANYGAAIASARLQNTNSLYEHLEEAVSKDAGLKEKAMNDLEFVDYWDAQQFQEIME